MSHILSDLRRLLKNQYISVPEIAASYEISEETAKENLEELVDQDILRQSFGERYVVADGVESKELISNFRQQFNEYYEDLTTDISDALGYR